MATEKILNTRVQLRHDTYTAWYNANPFLKKGEIALATISANHTDPSTGKVTQRPVVVAKVGTGVEGDKASTGTSYYNNLPFLSATSADVYDWAKQANLPIERNDPEGQVEGNVISGIKFEDNKIK